jgi:hypothetical protein
VGSEVMITRPTKQQVLIIDSSIVRAWERWEVVFCVSSFSQGESSLLTMCGTGLETALCLCHMQLNL